MPDGHINSIKFQRIKTKINQIIDNGGRSTPDDSRRLPQRPFFSRQAAPTFLLTSNEDEMRPASHSFIKSSRFIDPSITFHRLPFIQILLFLFLFCFCFLLSSRLRCKSTNFEPIFLHILSFFDDQIISTARAPRE